MVRRSEALAARIDLAGCRRDRHAALRKPWNVGAHRRADSAWHRVHVSLCHGAAVARRQSKRAGIYMGMQQTYGGITRAIAPVLYGRAFDTLGVASPYYFSSAIIAATILLGFGLDKYARHEPATAPVQEAPKMNEAEELPEMAMAAGASSGADPEALARE